MNVNVKGSAARVAEFMRKYSERRKMFPTHDPSLALHRSAIAMGGMYSCTESTKIHFIDLRKYKNADKSKS